MDQEDLVGIDIPGAPGDDNEEDGSGMDIPAEAAASALSPGVTRRRGTRAGVEPEEDNEEPGSLTTGEEEPVRRRAGPLTAEKAAYNRARPGKRERAQRRRRSSSSSRRRQRSRSRRASKPSPQEESESTSSEKVLAAAPKKKSAAKTSLKKKAGEGKPGKELNPGDLEAGAPDTEAVRPQLLRAEIEVAQERAPDLLDAPGVETRPEDQSEPGENQAKAEARGVKEELPEEHPTP